MGRNRKTVHLPREAQVLWLPFNTPNSKELCGERMVLKGRVTVGRKPSLQTRTLRNADTNLHSLLASIQSLPPSFFPCLLLLTLLSPDFLGSPGGSFSLGNLPPTCLSQMAEISAALNLITPHQQLVVQKRGFCRYCSEGAPRGMETLSRSSWGAAVAGRSWQKHPQWRQQLPRRASCGVTDPEMRAQRGASRIQAGLAACAFSPGRERAVAVAHTQPQPDSLAYLSLGHAPLVIPAPRGGLTPSSQTQGYRVCRSEGLQTWPWGRALAFPAAISLPALDRLRVGLF